MNTLQEITEIVKQEVQGPSQPNLTKDEVYTLLNIAKTTDSFVEQAKSLFYIISRYGKYKHYSPCESDIKSLSLCK